jgi:hypothetical protein
MFLSDGLLYKDLRFYCYKDSTPMSFRNLPTEDLTGRTRELYFTLRSTRAACQKNGYALPTDFQENERKLTNMLQELARRRSAEWRQQGDQFARVG